MPAGSLRKSVAGVAVLTALLLLVPALAMQFTAEVAWGPGDFLLAGLLLFSAGLLMLLGLRHVDEPGRRVAVVSGVALGLALVWAELAVGLFH